jgi:hypothetical protein
MSDPESLHGEIWLDVTAQGGADEFGQVDPLYHEHHLLLGMISDPDMAAALDELEAREAAPDQHHGAVADQGAHANAAADADESEGSPRDAS